MLALMKGKFPNGLKAAMDRAQIGTTELARRTGEKKQNIDRYKSQARKLPLDKAKLYAPVLGVTVADLLLLNEPATGTEDLRRVPVGEEFAPTPEFTDSDSSLVSDLDRSSSDVIPEVEAKGGAGEGKFLGDATVTVGAGGIITAHRVVAEWGIPPNYIRHELRASPRSTWILEVIGESMEPTLRPGDRVIYDVSDQVVNPDGIFVIDEGHGPMVKRLHRIRGVTPITYEILSDNKLQPSYTLDENQFRIIGRVCGRISRM